MKYRKILLGSAICFASMQLTAAPLTPEQALARVKGDNTLRSGAPSLFDKSLKLVDSWLMPKSGHPALYVYQSVSDNNPSFIILSADDNAETLLARVDGIYDYNSIPAACKYWLEEFTRQVEYAASHPVEEEKNDALPKKIVAFADRENILPLVKAKWSQNYPYNMYTPVSNQGNYVTGCVATAMAQVMSAHKWPLKGEGSHSYTWNNQTLSIDFSELTFDWEIMPDEWSWDQADNMAGYEEIAKLMKAVGYSVNMMYGPESGAPTQYVSPSLFEYFGYSKSSLVCKDTYCERDWTDMLYKELAAGRPIIYDGSDPDTWAAHCFVCDGYSVDGTFHFNWGWGGRYDGYFRLSALRPSGVGTGGGTGNYSASQKAIIGLARPDTPGLPRVWPLYAVGGFSSNYSNPITDGAEVEFNFGSGFVLNNSDFTFEGNLGIEVVKDGKTVMIWPGWLVDFKGLTPTLSMNGFSRFEATATTSTLEPGMYQLLPAFRMSGTDWWYRIPIEQGTQQFVSLKVSEKRRGMISAGGVYYMPDIEISRMEVIGKPVSGEECEFRIYYRNGTPDFKGNIYLNAQLDGGSVVIGGTELNVKADAVSNTTASIPMDIAQGAYTVFFTDAYGNVISDYMTLNVKEPSGIESIQTEDNACEYYDMLGRRVETPSKGVIIIHDSRGNISKQVR